MGFVSTAYFYKSILIALKTRLGAISACRNACWNDDIVSKGVHCTPSPDNILSLSDQQLPVLRFSFAALTYRCLIRFYEWISLAWVSSTTPLAALDALQVCLKANPEIRNWRVLGMVGLMLFGELFQDACVLNTKLRSRFRSSRTCLLLASPVFFSGSLYEGRDHPGRVVRLKGLKLSLSYEYGRRHISIEVDSEGGSLRE